MSASWNGKVKLSEADAKPGHYYVTVKDRGRTAFALGPFTQSKPGKNGHAQALGYIQKVRLYVHHHDHSVYEPWYEYGTSRIDICGTPPQGKLNAALLTA